MADFIDYRDHELHVEIKEDNELVEVNYRDDGKLHTMERHISDPMEKTLIRIGRNFQKKNNKKQKKGSKKSSSNGERSPDVIKLIRVDGTIATDLGDLTNAQWETGMRVVVHEKLTLTVVLNAPIVVSVGVYPKKYARVNNPLVPHVDHKFSCGIRYAWYAKPADECAEYVFVSDEFIFRPGPELVGGTLKLYCTPYRCSDHMPVKASRVTVSPSGEQSFGRTVVQYWSKYILPETALPKSLDCRKSFLNETPSHLNSSSLRLVTFNILASAYVQSAHALSVLYNYLENPDMLLSDEYRLQLVIKELLAYRADIMCLQEVDRNAFQKYLDPILTQDGYASHHTTKNGSTAEGCATFVSKSMFNMLATINISMKDTFSSLCNSSDHYLHDLLTNRPEIRDILTRKVTTIAQISIINFKNKPEHVCLVVNTHLFYHPDAEYIRLLQLHEIIQRLENIKSSILQCNDDENTERALKRYLDSILSESEEASENESNGFELQLKQSEYNSEELHPSCELKQNGSENVGCREDGQICIGKCDLQVSCFVFGDLNSMPRTGAIEYLENGVVESGHCSWNSVDVFSWSKDEPINRNNIEIDLTPSACHIPLLSHKFHWHCATGYPLYSNYTQTFKELLDYIYVEKDKCQVLQIAPIPTEEVMSENCAIPSETFPSDHLSLVVDVQLMT